MDLNGWVLAATSFAGGWLIRGTWVDAPKPEPTACACNCQWSGSPKVFPETSSNTNTLYGILFAVILCALALVYSNVALACRINLRGETPGSERELTISVKEKSKGVKGASQGLALTG